MRFYMPGKIVIGVLALNSINSVVNGVVSVLVVMNTPACGFSTILAVTSLSIDLSAIAIGMTSAYSMKITSATAHAVN